MQSTIIDEVYQIKKSIWRGAKASLATKDELDAAILKAENLMLYVKTSSEEESVANLLSSLAMNLANLPQKHVTP